MSTQPKQHNSGFLELVNDANPAARVEGGYALGYLKGKTGFTLLNLLAKKDPFAPSALAVASTE